MDGDNTFGYSAGDMGECVECAKRVKAAYAAIEAKLAKVNNDHLPKLEKNNEDIHAGIKYQSSGVKKLLENQSIYDNIIRIRDEGDWALEQDEQIIDRAIDLVVTDLSTNGMIVTKFAEGLAESGENIIDGVLSGAAFILGICGAKGAESAINNFVAIDAVKSTIESTGVYKFLDSHSAIKGDGTLANIIEGVGVGVGYAVMASTMTPLVGSLAATTGASEAVLGTAANMAVAWTGGFGHGTAGATSRGVTGSAAYTQGVIEGNVEAAFEVGGTALLKGINAAIGSGASAAAHEVINGTAGELTVGAVGDTIQTIVGS